MNFDIFGIRFILLSEFYHTSIKLFLYDEVVKNKNGYYKASLVQEQMNGSSG